MFVALLGRALRLGDVEDARRRLAQIGTPERRDEGRALIAATLAKRDEFVNAAAELDAMVVDALRALAAEHLLTQSPRIAGDEHASLSLLLALDGDPARLAAVVASVVEQAPESALAAALAKAFAPLQAPGLGEAVDALLDTGAVRDRTKKKALEALRARVAAEPTLSARVVIDGTVSLLLRESLVDEDEGREVSAALLGGAG